jgi:CubicO group peptidase (beta-lactamase class C family)
MKHLFICVLLALATTAFAQTKIAALATAEYEAGHFNGTLLAVKNGRVAAQVSRGKANLQFGVPITADTRFPIASMTKLFTAILALQLVEQGHLQLDAPAATYVRDLPAACQAITIRALLTHISGLKNEPIRAYQTAYSTQEFVQRFVVKDSAQKTPAFNYNNVDYVVLTAVLETVAKQPYAALVQTHILAPLRMRDTGVLAESRVIPRLAYGYHNYTFGNGSARDTLRNDRRYLSNYAGAGALYSTTADLYKLVQGLQAHALLSAATSEAYLLKPQQATFAAYARGYPTIGFYYNDKTLATPLLERRGSIDGFNSVLLTNTDQADLEKLGDKVYDAF